MLRALCVLCLLASLAGCLPGRPTAVIAEYRPCQMLETTPAPRTCTYVLHRVEAANGDRRAPTTVCAQAAVERGAPIGFGWDEGGRVVALAGAEKVPIEAGCHFWVPAPGGKRRIDAAQANIEKVGEKVGPFVLPPLQAFAVIVRFVGFD